MHNRKGVKKLNLYVVLVFLFLVFLLLSELHKTYTPIRKLKAADRRKNWKINFSFLHIYTAHQKPTELVYFMIFLIIRNYRRKIGVILMYRFLFFYIMVISCLINQFATFNFRISVFNNCLVEFCNIFCFHIVTSAPFLRFLNSFKQFYFCFKTCFLFQ